MDAEIPQPVPTALAVIETDAYCEACGYNLRTQPVWRDDRLGVIVCRCPECGAHRAAGLMTAGSLWGRRLATALLLVWVVVCVAGVLAAAGVTLALQQEAGGVFTYACIETRGGEQVRYYNFYNVSNGQTVYWPTTVDIDFRQDPNNTNGQYKAYSSGTQTEVATNGPPFLNPSDVVIRYHAADWLTGQTGHPVDIDYRTSSPGWEAAAVYTGVNGLLAALFGLIMACVCWHWDRRRRWVWAVMPMLMLTVSLTLFRTTSHRWMPTGLATDRDYLATVAVLGLAVWQMLAVALGLLVGRAIVRGLVRLFVPRLARTPLSFLWAADHKPLPRAVV